MNAELLILGSINIAPLVRAHAQLKQGMLSLHSDLERDGVVKRFEYTYELAWKTLKKILMAKGLESNSPRDVFRDAAKLHLIDDPKVWFDFIDKRNLTSHTYNEASAQEVVEVLPEFEKAIDKLIVTIKRL